MMANEDEGQLRVELMSTQIERLRQEIRTENRKFIVSVIVAIAALLGAGVALGTVLGPSLRHLFS